VTFLAALVVPSNWPGNETGDGSNTTGATPVPLNVTESGLLLALVSMVNIAAGWAPTAVGLRTRFNAQVLSEPRLATLRQVDEGATAYGVPDATEIEMKLIADPPMFFTVTVRNALAVSTTTFPKFTEFAETVICARATVDESSVKAAKGQTTDTAATRVLREECIHDSTSCGLHHSQWVLPAERRKEPGPAARNEYRCFNCASAGVQISQPRLMSLQGRQVGSRLCTQKRRCRAVEAAQP